MGKHALSQLGGQVLEKDRGESFDIDLITSAFNQVSNAPCIIARENRSTR